VQAKVHDLDVRAFQLGLQLPRDGVAVWVGVVQDADDHLVLAAAAQ
jgi:hypothetical protein